MNRWCTGKISKSVPYILSRIDKWFGLFRAHFDRQTICQHFGLCPSLCPGGQKGRGRKHFDQGLVAIFIMSRCWKSALSIGARQIKENLTTYFRATSTSPRISANNPNLKSYLTPHPFSPSLPFPPLATRLPLNLALFLLTLLPCSR